MTDKGRNDKCPCGSGKKYKSCCMERNDATIKSGCLFVSIFYPEYIHIAENSGFLFEVNDKLVIVAIKKHLNPLEILDFDNSLIENDKPGTPNKKEFSIKKPINSISDETIGIGAYSIIAKLLDYKDHLHRLFTPRFYTEIVISFEAGEDEYINGTAFTFHESVLDKFINSYRLLTKDVEVKSPNELYNDSLVVKTCWMRNTRKELELKLEERLSLPRYMKFDIRQMKYEKYGGSIPTINPEREQKASTYLSSYLRANRENTIVEDLFIKAIEEFKVNKNYKYALLNAFTSVEVAVSSFLCDFKIKNGVSKKKLEDYKNEIGISYMLNVEIPMVFKELADKDRITIGEVDKVRRKRNDVIHNGAKVTDKEAREAINAVIKLLQLIDPKKYEVLCFSLE